MTTVLATIILLLIGGFLLVIGLMGVAVLLALVAAPFLFIWGWINKV